ncbi:hypothetical protein [Streptomyces sp. NPDC047130]|uniref:hypothetical protein n=1 Tax=Streptomyces sp. NPDC047130 TaxID=3155261 RepID=UPI0033DC9926
MPSWEDQTLGTMKRVALWLVQVVGVGNTFTKNQLRETFQGVSQVDRRMRDLRDFEWKIDTNREDDELEADQHRFVAQGIAVWEPGKGTRKTGGTITAAQRHEVLMRDGHMCRSCGIGPGETYVGTDATSQLDVARRQVRLPNGQIEMQLVIECNRCRIGNRNLVANVDDLLSRINLLPAYEKKILAGWVVDDARHLSELERIWADYRSLPAEARQHVKDALC